MDNNASFTQKYLRRIKQKELNIPHYSVLEELLNAITHGIGVLFAVAAIVLFSVFSVHKPMTLVCVTIYASTLFVMYVVSTIYHALGMIRAKRLFRVLDHCSIFILIAGTYTPISLVVLSGYVGWILFGSIWAAAVVGIVLNSIDLNRFAKVSSVCYQSMGWCVVLTFKLLFDKTTLSQILTLLIGGVFYTIGAVIYNKGKKWRYMHSVWHVFVLVGSVLHFLFIFNYTKAL